MTPNRTTMGARTLCLLITLGLLATLTQAFLPLPLSMRVGRTSNPQRSKSVGILNSMRENINSQANPTQVCARVGVCVCVPACLSVSGPAGGLD
jgi:hypothetical protein